MNVLAELKELLNDESLAIEGQLQSLWSGYGQIIRCTSKSNAKSYVVKVVAPPEAIEHPRGWNTQIGHLRKLKSYQVEACFYQEYADKTDVHTKVPQLITSKVINNVTLLVMEDLDEAGYFVRKDKADWPSLAVAIRWLAFFHVKFMHHDGKGLWPQGCYWHLATRQDEWQAMPESPFKRYASELDLALAQTKYQSLLHGDAKFENLCFSEDGLKVAAVDFQYAGLGAGVKDLAYLAGSCLADESLFLFDDKILAEYLVQLEQAVEYYQLAIDFKELAQEVTRLYPVAWADFYRFLLGWNPDSWKICAFMKDKAQQGLEQVNA